jgi:putative two-component system response regulator
METTGKNILVVDDTEANIDILVDALGTEYEVSVALDGPTALEIVEESLPDLILLDIMMPGMNGFQVCEKLKNNPQTAPVPVIFLTAMDQLDAKTKGFQIGAVDYVTKPFEILEVKARVQTHLLLKEAQDVLERENEVLEKRVRARTKELLLTRDVTIQSLASLAETRDNETGGHIMRTQNYVRIMAETLTAGGSHTEFLTPGTINLLSKSAPLHDIGKVGIPDKVLLKPGKLSDEEFNIMKTHTTLGRDALLKAEGSLGSSSFLRHARDIAYTHHEKWDGSGYPEGMKGEAIPVSGRIMAIADVYDALITKRVYKPPFTHSKAVMIILAGRESQFDPVMVDCFDQIKTEIKDIAIEFADSQEELEALKQ